MGFLEYPLIRLGLVFLLGILLSRFLALSFEYLGWIIGSLILLLICCHLLPVMYLKKQVFGLFCFAMVFILGAYSYKHKEATDFQEQQLFLTAAKDAIVSIQLLRMLNENDYYLKYRARAMVISSGEEIEFLLRIRKDQYCYYSKLGAQFIAKADFSQIPGPKNPYDFDYAEYMRPQGLRLQSTLSINALIEAKNQQRSIFLYPAIWQQNLVALLKQKIQKPEHRQLLSALLFGDKTDLSATTKRQFATAGVMHLLAVSGLHLGIVMLFARWIFGGLKRLPYGHKLMWICVLLVIWVFAIVTGASASVLRAATLFSFLIIGRLMGRNTSSMNSLFASMWLLLLINPFFAFQVGFQLSYLAVFYILWLMPKWNKVYRFKNLYYQSAWQITGVSLVAQWGTAPISLFYFHSFPSYFLLTNLVLLPMMSLLMIYGFLSVLITSYLPALDGLILPLEKALDLMLAFIKLIEGLPHASLDVPNYNLQVLIAFLISSMVVALHFRTSSKRIIPVIASCSIALMLLFQFDKEPPHERLLVNHQFGRTQLIHQMGRTAWIYQNQSVNEDYSLGQFLWAQNVESLKESKIPHLFSHMNKQILMIDGSFGLHPGLGKINIILLTNNAKIHLERWIHRLKPELIIADGSSYPSVKEKWRKTTLKEELPYYDTADKGAFIFE